MAETENNSEGGFLGRWSRRKRIERSDTAPAEATEEQPVDDIPVDSDSLAEQILASDTVASEPVADRATLVEADQQILTDEDMPPLESLNADSDYSPFFSEGVSKQLRNMALKRLFFSGKFGLRDGLDDYDDDFTKFEPLGNTVTSDMKFHQRRKEKARLARLEEERLEREQLKQKQLEEARPEEERPDQQLAANDELQSDQDDEVLANSDVPADEQVAATASASQFQGLETIPEYATPSPGLMPLNSIAAESESLTPARLTTQQRPDAEQHPDSDDEKHKHT